MRKIYSIVTLLMLGLITAHASTLKDVKKRGYLKCGVSTGVFGMSYTDDKGTWKGIDVQICRALAAAIFANPHKVRFTALSPENRFMAIQSGHVDVLSRNSTWTLARDTDLGLDFAGISWYDGQGFIVNRKLNIKSIKDLDTATICIEPGTTTELTLSEYFKLHNISYEPVIVKDVVASAKAIKAGRCDVYTSDTTSLVAMRSSLPDPQEWVVLPELISKEPLGPAVRHGDNQWADIVHWTLNTMIAAEEFGITSKNVDSQKTSKNQEVLRILGYKGTLGKFLGLPKDFGYAIIKQVGNYGEVYSRTLGSTGLPRGLNRLWTKGGLLYAPPFR